MNFNAEKLRGKSAETGSLCFKNATRVFSARSAQDRRSAREAAFEQAKHRKRAEVRFTGSFV
jgi:hypothetical protein